jgi:hypothetical protein
MVIMRLINAIPRHAKTGGTGGFPRILGPLYWIVKLDRSGLAISSDYMARALDAPIAANGRFAMEAASTFVWCQTLLWWKAGIR